MIYFIQAAESNRIKIGFTAADPVARMADLQTGSPEPLRLIGTMPGDLEDERRLHSLYTAHRLHGEWFHPAPILLRFIAIACSHPEHEFLSGAASYQRGYLDAARRAISVVRQAGSVAAAEQVLNVICNEIDHPYRDGIAVRRTGELEDILCRLLAHQFGPKPFGWADSESKGA